MLRRILLIIFIVMVLPAHAEYKPLSEAPINNVQDFEEAEDDKAEFEYTPSKPQSPPATNIQSTKNYAKIYNDLEPANFKFMHNMDPDQFYDIKDTAWSPYPLLRLNSPIYFKNVTIEPGYYLLTPREYKGKWYMLFKQNGLVSYIIPVYDRGITPAGFYETHLSKPKLKFSQKVHMGVLSGFGKLKSSKRRDPIKSYMEINDLENNFVSIIIYYSSHKYSTIFRTVKL